jgi:hypothetical protein
MGTRILIGLVALALAYATGSLAMVAAGPAFSAGLATSFDGQLRGIVFTVVMAAVTAGLLWVALRSFVRAAG